MARNGALQHIGKSGAFTTGELNVREIGIDTTNQDVYFSTDGSNVVQIGTGGGGSDYIHYDSAITDWYGNTAADLDSIATAGLSLGYKQTFHSNDYGRMVYELSSALAPRVTISSVDTGTDVITTSSTHSAGAFREVLFHTTGTLPAGISPYTVYYANTVTSNTLKISTTRANAESGTSVDITDSGTGTHAMFVLEHHNKIVPADYAVSTNQRLWFLREVRQPVTFQKEFFGETQDLALGTYHWMYVPKAFRVSAIFFSVATTSNNAQVMLKVDGSNALHGAPDITTAATHGGGAYHSIVDHTFWKSSLWNMSQGKHLELEVTDTGDASGVKCKGLIATLVGHYIGAFY